MTNQLIFKYIFQTVNFFFIKIKNFNFNYTSLFLPPHYLFYAALHLKLSSAFYPLQLVDTFAYQSARAQNALVSANESIIVYQFFNLFETNRIFLFLLYSNPSKSSLTSIAELFMGANWLEREVSELFGIVYFNKKDKRNLMLTYGDFSAPFTKIFPAIGWVELSYNAVFDTILFTRISIQN